jgi:hypothetical protein
VNGAAVPLNRTVIVPLKPVPVMTTLLPTGPLVGLSEEIVGAPGVIVKSVALVAVPFGVTTWIRPVVAPAGTVAVMRVLLFTVNVALVPLKRTAETSVKFVPLIWTDVPGAPLVGLNDEMVGALAVTMKAELLVAVPRGVTTWIAPVTALFGTTAVIRMGETTVKLDALTPPNRTAVAPWKSVPLMVTVVPGGPEGGVNEEIVGGLFVVTMKSVALVTVPSLGTLTAIRPVDAPAGTVAVIWVPAWLTVKVAFTPLNVTWFALSKLVPVMVTEVPTGPLDGVNPVMVWLARAAGASAIPTICSTRTHAAARDTRPLNVTEEVRTLAPL